MLETLRKLCGIPKSKFLTSMEFTGNTVSNTIPIVLHNQFREQDICDGKSKVLILGFGVGLSWSGGIVFI
jgi:3-oxoacyl-[acyl-carrier-protein] synthase-3